MCEKVIIIGSGLGGLACGAILSRNGYDVTVMEQAGQIGGCLQCFVRKGAKFETGMHFIGSADEGQTLDRLMKFLGIRNDLVLDRLNPDAYDIISLDGQRYCIPNGFEALVDRLSCYFPDQHQNILDYVELVKAVNEASSMHSLRFDDTDRKMSSEYLLKPIDEVIRQRVTDSRLADVLVGNLPLYAAEPGRTPFSTHAFIMDFYNQSAFRVAGGSDHIAAALKCVIERNGGKVMVRSKVTEIVCDESKAVGVTINGTDFVPADYVISDAHPKRTLELLNTKLIRPVFRKRVNAMRQGIGCFSLYIHFKENAVPYMNSNFYGYEYGTPWNCENYDGQTWPKGYLYMHLCHQPSPKFAKTAVVLTYMKMDDVAQWIGTSPLHRGAEYEKFKQQKAERLLDVLEHQFPGIRSTIQHFYTSTPLTYLDYTGTDQGSMYGIAKDVTLGNAGRVPHRMKVPNVLQTGQNINSHGMLGVLVGAVVTTGELIDKPVLYKQIIEA